MKKILLCAGLCVLMMVSMAQTNKIDPIVDVGIGTTTPVTTLELSKNTGTATYHCSEAAVTIA